MADLESLDFKFCPCNCNICTKINGKCAFGGKCRAKCIVYKVTCKVCREIYVGVMQSDFKQRITGHSTLLKNYLDEKPDTKVSELTKHLARTNHWPELDPKTPPQMICCKLKFKNIYQANLDTSAIWVEQMVHELI
eukprot:15340283-Ditylum_brightwellii.AAC.1